MVADFNQARTYPLTVGFVLPQAAEPLVSASADTAAGGERHQRSETWRNARPLTTIG